MTNSQSGLIFSAYDQKFMPSDPAAAEIAYVFRSGYPSMHPPETRTHDLARYESGKSIADQIRAGNIWMTATFNGRILSILKYRSEKRLQGIDGEQSLLAWVITRIQDRRTKIASKLIGVYLDNLRRGVGTQSLTGQVVVVADVMKINDPSVALFESSGFESLPGKSENHYLMTKSIDRGFFTS